MIPIAQVDAGVVAVLIPIAAILVGGLIAITTMMTNHQRKMAELLRKDVQAQPGLVDELRAMRAELSELRDRVNQQTIAIESNRRPVPTEMPQRLQE